MPVGYGTVVVDAVIWLISVIAGVASRHLVGKPCPKASGRLISLVLWKLLASSSRAIAGALDTMSKRLQGVLDESKPQDLVEILDEDYESLDETAEEWEEETEPNSLSQDEYQAIADEIEELKHFKTLAENIREDAKSRALIKALDTAFAKLKELGAAQKPLFLPNPSARKIICCNACLKVNTQAKMAKASFCSTAPNSDEKSAKNL